MDGDWQINGSVTGSEIKQYLIQNCEIKSATPCEVEYCGVTAFSQIFHCPILNQHVLFKNISVIGKLRHPNLALFYGAVLDSNTKECGRVVILTEMLQTSLHQVLQVSTYLNENEAVSIGCNIAGALVFLHHKEYYISTVMDFIPPSNVLLKRLHNGHYDAKLLIATESSLLSTKDPFTAANLHDIYIFGHLFLTMVTGSTCYPSQDTAVDQNIIDACNGLASPALIALLTDCLLLDANLPPCINIRNILTQLQVIDHTNNSHSDISNSIPKVYNC